MRDTYTRNLACSECHRGFGSGMPSHSDGIIDLAFQNNPYTGTDTASYSQSPNIPGDGYGSCSNVYCHSIVQKEGGAPIVLSTADYRTPAWTEYSGEPTPEENCKICHLVNYYDATVDSSTSGSHPRHLLYARGNAFPMVCATCHLGWSHTNGIIEIGFADGSWGDLGINISATASYSQAGSNPPGNGYGNCSTTYCHSNGKTVSGSTVGQYAASIMWGSNGTLTCTGCHQYPPAYANSGPGSTDANSHEKHVTAIGITCDKCHNSTTADGSTIRTDRQPVTHVNAGYDVNNYQNTLLYDTASKTCSNLSCHGNAVWGGTPPPLDYTNCVGCHSSPMGARRQIVDSNADGTGTGGDFKKTSRHHNAASGTATNADCVVCHDTSQHPRGPIRLKNADTGEIYTYNPANPATAENHCLSCHDTNGANGNMSPFTDGKALGVAPYQASVDIKSNWDKSFGHRQQGLTCLGNGSPNTGCHAGGHGSDYKGLLSRNLTLPNPNGDWYSAADEGSYDLCFNCHQSYSRVSKEAILGYRAGGNYDISGDGPPPYGIPNILTKFRDQNYNKATGNFYDDYYNWTGFSNLHYFHIQFPSSWSYRATTTSSIQCVSCHNVHGSNTQNGWVYDEMQYNHYTGEGSDLYGTMDIPSYSNLSNYPINCTFNCHSFQGKTYNWYEPSNE